MNPDSHKQKNQYQRKPSYKKKDNKASKNVKQDNRFAELDQEQQEGEDPATSDNTSSISDFSFGEDQWSLKKISDVFKRLSSEQNPKRITRIVEKGLHQICYEAHDKPEFIIRFVTCALERINVEKGILDSVKRLRILEEVDTKCTELLEVCLNKLKNLNKEKSAPKVSPKKLKIIQEREEAIISFLGYFVFKHPVMSKEEYLSIYQTFEWYYIKYFQGKYNSNNCYITQCVTSRYRSEIE